MRTALASAPVSGFSFPFTPALDAEEGDWADTDTGASKLQGGGDASAIYETADGNFAYAHRIEGVGPVPGPSNSYFTRKGMAALAADIDYLSLTSDVMASRFDALAA